MAYAYSFLVYSANHVHDWPNRLGALPKHEMRPRCWSKWFWICAVNKLKPSNSYRLGINFQDFGGQAFKAPLPWHPKSLSTWSDSESKGAFGRLYNICCITSNQKLRFKTKPEAMQYRDCYVTIFMLYNKKSLLCTYPNFQSQASSRCRPARGPLSIMIRVHRRSESGGPADSDGRQSSDLKIRRFGFE